MDGQQGFTLTEIMATIIIIGILVAIAYPSMMEIFRRMEARKVESVIYSALIDARNESYITRQNLIVCPADESNICNKLSKKKIIIFRDFDNNATFNEGEMVREYDLNLKYGYLNMRVSLARNYIKYFGNSATPRGHFGHIKYCSESSKQELSYRMVLTHQGRIRKSLEEVGC